MSKASCHIFECLMLAWLSEESEFTSRLFFGYLVWMKNMITLFSPNWTYVM